MDRISEQFQNVLLLELSGLRRRFNELEYIYQSLEPTDPIKRRVEAERIETANAMKELQQALQELKNIA